ncbi:hypothetical protein P5P86_16375 [Nocardioides sp. BP30]|uniref:hypothetical protein n=1 Tax=Nocardioides sp. BP30 TaxID=3036374 RepID=UPI002468F2E6|nr:hypothetical protein [Nocardioides sp. BP30]WGL51530.1 hypothetical protein P5P86_16375 [Nocardioides sp. BP30]
MSLNHPREENKLDLGGVPAEEDVSAADAAERVDQDPEEQPNFTEEHGQRTQVNQPEPDSDPAPETGPDREESIELDKPEYDDA